MTTNSPKESDPSKDPEFQKVVRRFLKTPPKPHTAKVSVGDTYYLVIGDKMRIAQETCRHEDGSITVDLFRNLDDYKAGRVMEHDFTYRP